MPGSHSKCWSALHMRVPQAHRLCALLLQWGIDVELKDVNGATAKDLAKKKGFTEIVELIEGAERRPEKARSRRSGHKEVKRPKRRPGAGLKRQVNYDACPHVVAAWSIDDSCVFEACDSMNAYLR